MIIEHGVFLLLLLIGAVAPLASLGMVPLVVALTLGVGIALRPVTTLPQRLTTLFDRRSGLMVALMILWSGLSLTWSLDVERSASLWGRLWLLALFGFLLILAGREAIPAWRQAVARAAPWILPVTVGVIMLFCLTGTLRNWIPGLDVDISLEKWCEPLKPGVNILALLFPVLLLVPDPETRRRRLGIGLVWIALTVSLTSASGQLALGLGLALYLGTRWLSPAVLGRLRPVLAVVVAGGILLGPMALNQVLTPAMIQETAPRLPLSFRHRLYVWKFTLDRIEERPWRGWGLESARAIPGGKQKTPSGGEFMPLHPHNGVLHIWLELGFFGALALATLLGWLLARAGRHLPVPHQAVLLASVGSGMVSMLLSFGLWQNWWIATQWLTAALLVARLWPASDAAR